MKVLSCLFVLLVLPMTASLARTLPHTSAVTPTETAARSSTPIDVLPVPSGPVQTLIASSGGCFGGEFIVEFDTTPECNCTGQTGVISICHKEIVEVVVGGWPVSVTTGKSTSSCFRQSVASGTCLFYRYKLKCCDRALFGYTCRFIESQSRQKPTNCS